MKHFTSALVTGVSGFIGSHVAEALAKDWNVIGIDCFTDFYSRKVKERNLAKLMNDKNFRFIEADLLEVDLRKMDIDFVFHQAGQPGVIDSWGENFEIYARNNILATQRLLESFKNTDLKKFIFASSSSVYGDTVHLPTIEEYLPRPFSPYGVTKLAAENLCYLYWRNYGVPTVALRYFTVYGPRQRPDMAISTFVKAILNDNEISIYGDGKQTRDLTYVSDVVQANIAASESNIEGETFNIAGGSRISVNALVSLLEKIIGKESRKRYSPRRKGDVENTWACIDRARKILNYRPKVTIEEGLKKYVKWYLENVPFSNP